MNTDPIKEFFSKANPNPLREGCPGNRVLRLIALNKLSETDPARLHLASCSPCFSEFRALKTSLVNKKQHKQKVLIWFVAAACLLLVSAIAITFVATKGHKSGTPGPEITALLTRTVDLSSYGTSRGGEAKHLESVVLPSARVRVIVALPKLSNPGSYTVSVSPDQTSGRVLSSGAAMAQGGDDRRTVTVLLDLRAAHAGSYFLATTHDQDEASYFYPLKID